MNRRQATKWKAKEEKEWRMEKREILAFQMHRKTRRRRQTREWWKAWHRRWKAEWRKRREDEYTD